MRAFISIELPKEVRDELWELQKGFKNLAKVKWVAKKNYHVCLKFLGDIDDSKVKEVKGALKKVKFTPFEVNLGEIGVFPNESHINVIWVGLEPSSKIINLQSDIEDSLYGLFARAKKFAVHVTVGRVKGVKDKKKFIEKLKSLQVRKLKFKIENFYLVKSELTKEGPKYKILEKF